MVKRVGVFAMIIFGLVPLLAMGSALGGLFLPDALQTEAAYEVFGKQNTQSVNILLADTEGKTVMVCILAEGKTQLISILPSAAPKGKQDTTFRAVYQKEGIKGLKREIGESLLLEINGYLEVDFSGLGSVVDALGDVTIAGKTYTGKELQTCFEKMAADPAEAMAQQDGVLAVGRHFCNAGFWKGQNAFRKFMKLTDTDLSVSSLVKIGKALIPALEGNGLQRYCLPEEGKWVLAVSAVIS